MNNKANILYVVSSLKKCGPTNQLYGITKFLDKEQFSITILTLFEEKNGSDINRFIDNNIRIDSLEIKNTKNYYKIIQKLKKYSNNKKIDIVHSSGLAADFCCCFLSNIVHVSSIRNYAYFDYISAYGNIYGRIMIILNKWAMEHTDYCICCSKSIKLMYEKKIKKKLDYIQNGVDIETFKFIPEIKMIEREKLNLPKDKIIFIVSGSLCERKDPIFIIDCFRDIALNNKACLLFIGEGELYDECKKYQSEYILFRGAVDNVNSYLHAADIYISASKSEGLPNSVLEAGACGLQLILSEIPQHKEIFEDNSNLAKFFALNNKTQFMNYINEIIYDNYKSNNEVVLSIEKNFSSEKNSKKYSELYNKIIYKGRFL